MPRWYPINTDWELSSRKGCELSGYDEGDSSHRRRLAERSQSGAPVLIVARNSTSQGDRGRQQAAQDAVLAVAALAKTGILDLTAEIPSEEEIALGIAQSSDVVTIDDTKWRYYSWTSSDGRGVLLVCAGSGRKTDSLGSQPFMERLNVWIRGNKPCLVWAKEVDRFGRDEIGSTKLARAITDISKAGHECWLGSGDKGVVDRYQDWDIPIYIEGRQNRAQADSFLRRTRLAMEHQTGEAMQDGRVVFSLPNALPPGLGRGRLRDENGREGQSIAFLDGESTRPKSDELFVPVTYPRTSWGSTSDQIKNVRGALGMYADGVEVPEIGEWLWNNGFTTEHFQRTHTPGASYRTVYSNPEARVLWKIVNSITRRVDFYATGILSTTVDGRPLSINGCIPDGGWATGDQIARIRARLDKGERHTSQRVRSLLGGLPVTVDGRDARLSLYSQSCTCHAVEGPDSNCTPRYRLIPVDGPPFLLTVSSGALIDSMVNAIADTFRVGGAPRLALKPSKSDYRDNAENEVVRIDQSLKSLTESRRNLITNLESGVIPLNAMASIATRLTELEEEITSAQESLADAQVQLAAILSPAPSQNVADISILPSIVSVLNDPHSTTGREFLQDAVISLRISLPMSQLGGEVTWEGGLRIGSESEATEIRFHGCEATGSRPLSVAAVTEMFSQGIPITAPPSKRVADGMGRTRIPTMALAESVGLAKEDMWIASVSHPLLLRAHLSTFGSQYSDPDPVDLQRQIAAGFGDGVAFERALRRVHAYKRGHAKKTWMVVRSPGETAALIAAALGTSKGESRSHRLRLKQAQWCFVAGEWLPSRDGLRLRACPHCSGDARVRLVLDEAFGYVCLACRRDTAGVRWPAEDFDQFIAHAAAWREAGFGLSTDIAQGLDPAEEDEADSRVAKPCPPSQETAAEVVAAYQAGDKIGVIINRFGLRNRHEFYALLRREGVGASRRR